MHNEAEPVTDLEREIIDFFVNASQAIGLPKSVGEIYGLFFSSSLPLALDDVIVKLGISKGSASQGIRFLKSINALIPTYLPGDRRDHYLAETSLRRIADGFLKERLRPQLKDGTDRLAQLKDKYSTAELHSLNEKLKTIEAWSKKSDLLIPFVSKFLGESGKARVI